MGDGSIYENNFLFCNIGCVYNIFDFSSSYYKYFFSISILDYICFGSCFYMDCFLSLDSVFVCDDCVS